MSDAIWQAIGQGGPVLAVLVLVLWGGYRLADRLVTRTLATLDVLSARVSHTGDAVDRVEAKLADVADDVVAIRDRTDTGRHKTTRS